MELLKKIKSLIKSLPKNDISYAEKFIKERDFVSLKELVVSAIFITRKNLKSENPKQMYLNVNLTDLNQLRTEIDFYLSYLGELDNTESCIDLNDNYAEEY